ncbi:hypothetical protein M9H77_34031 [Catharanthus roseus]|uniref:Uncharacterized protein n=1 Tax=Catharanthus roseus TaxID=4058 RepID=A0ACB9ZMH3_CATRO|nr:hypothetical protein M9H77_34031 [Catharanthus roseus]
MNYICANMEEKYGKQTKMITKVPKVVSLFCFLLILSSSSHGTIIPETFVNCISNKFESDESIFSILHYPHNSSYDSVLKSTIHNLRFLKSPKPLAIITPLLHSHVQSAVFCTKQAGLQIRVRSGGADPEDLQNLRSISVNIEDKTAWVESGATIGELYYEIADKSPDLAFPAGAYPTVGVGGLFSGGGFGPLLRKYGLAADNIIDAKIVDARGSLLDRQSMGEDLFWAIRGGGGASFGAIVSWKIKLVVVPPMVSVFHLTKSLDQENLALLQKWQYIQHKLPEDLFLDIGVMAIPSGENKMIMASFTCLFLGKKEPLLNVMEENFPELGLTKEDCLEMSWIDAVMVFAGYQNGESRDALKNRKGPFPKGCISSKSDFIQEPLPMDALEKLWKFCLEEENSPMILMVPHGGKMSKISESEIPFPYRGEVIYSIMYQVMWNCEDDDFSQKYIDMIRRLYEMMSPYAMKQLRGAFLNVRDLDLGRNNDKMGTTYWKAKEWGLKYFNNSFKKLAIIKGQVDPENFFYYEQSIPPLHLQDEL